MPVIPTKRKRVLSTIGITPKPLKDVRLIGIEPEKLERLRNYEPGQDQLSTSLKYPLKPKRFTRELIRAKLYYADVKNRWPGLFKAYEFKKAWLLCLGLTVHEISEELGENYKTTKKTVGPILMKLTEWPSCESFIKKYAGKPGIADPSLVRQER